MIHSFIDSFIHFIHSFIHSFVQGRQCPLTSHATGRGEDEPTHRPESSWRCPVLRVEAEQLQIQRTGAGRLRHRALFLRCLIINREKTKMLNPPASIPTFKIKQHGGRTFCFSGAQIWNYLPFVVRNSPSFDCHCMNDPIRRCLIDSIFSNLFGALSQF